MGGVLVSRDTKGYVHYSPVTYLMNKPLPDPSKAAIFHFNLRPPSRAPSRSKKSAPAKQMKKGCKMNIGYKCKSKKPYKGLNIRFPKVELCVAECVRRQSAACVYDIKSFGCQVEWDKENPCSSFLKIKSDVANH